LDALRSEDEWMDFEPLREDFLRITASIIYCTVTTVDPEGRPRSRVMHPIFEVVEGHPRGWAVTDRTPLKSRHIAANPYVACSYWSPAQDTVAIDCTAEWVEDDSLLREVWDIFAAPRTAGLGRPLWLWRGRDLTSPLPRPPTRALPRPDPAPRTVRRRRL
jgi:general stress protein 26